MAQLKNLVDAKVKEAAGDKRLGWELAGDHIVSMINEGKIQRENLGFKRLFQELVSGVSLSASPERIAEALNSSAFPTIAQKVIHKDIIDEYQIHLGGVDKLIREKPATKTDEELVVGFEAGDTELQLRRQGMAYEETDFGEKNWKITMADFGRMISLTREVIFEDRTSEVMDRAKDIGRSAGHHKAKMIVQTIEGLARTAMEEATFQGCIYKGAAKTSANIYADTHATTFDGQVNDNLMASNALVNYTDIDNIYQLFAKMVDESGEEIDVVPNAILIPNALKATAAKILRSDTLLATGGTTTNVPTYNPIKDIGADKLDIITSRYLATTTAWYMGDFAKQILGLNVFAPQTASQGVNSELAFTNQIVARFRFSMHWGLGLTDYRYIVKSTA
jgi:hypothetical protein